MGVFQEDDVPPPTSKAEVAATADENTAPKEGKTAAASPRNTDSSVETVENTPMQKSG